MALALLAVLTSACAPGPAVRASIPAVPQTWPAGDSRGTTSATPPDELWWRAFHDEEFDKLIDATVAANYDLKVATARVEEARAAIGLARSGLFPQVSATGSVAASRQPVIAGANAATLGIAPADFANYQGGLDASWEIDVFHRVRLQVREAGARLAASEEDRHDVLVTLLGDVARYYADLRGLQARLEIARKRVRLEEDAASLSESTARAGFAMELDAINARAQLESARAAVPTLEEEAEVALHRLSVLTGREPGALRALLETAAPLPPVPPALPVGLPSDLLKRRPDIRRAEAELKAANTQLALAKLEYFPRFTLTGSAGAQAVQLHDFTLALGVFHVGPSVSVPVLTGGRIRSDIALQKARTEEAESAWIATILRSLEETENALSRSAREQDREERLAAEADQNGTAVELATVRYKAGLDDYFPVIAAERERLVSEDRLDESRMALVVGAIAICKAIGGGWTATAISTR
jgi:outer membrane protein, multidrug efflux system